MSYLSLYRKYRPMNFDQIVGQPHVVRTLKNAIESSRIAHAYLFAGPRGAGKTSVARIFAKSLNCRQGPTPNPCCECDVCEAVATDSLLDVIEIDAASNRGIDDIRDLKDKVKFPPSQARRKVYIIDEVHMLTEHAFNALLKTLEEPPSHVTFLLATTEPQKLLGTILSRCQRFDFRRIPNADVEGRLNEIAANESVDIEPQALAQLIHIADGSLRDAISILDQLVSYSSGKISADDVHQMLGLVDAARICDLMTAILDLDHSRTFEWLETFAHEGKSFNLFVRAMLEHLRDVYFLKEGAEPPGASAVGRESLERIRAISERLSRRDLFLMMEKAAEMEGRLKGESKPRLLAELLLIRLLELARGTDAQPAANPPAGVAERRAAPRPPAAASFAAPTAGPTPQAAPAVSQLAPEPAAGFEGELSPAAAADQWEQALKRVKAASKPLYFIMAESRVGDLGGDVLTINFGSVFHKEQAELEKNRALLEKELSAFFGRGLRVRCALDQPNGQAAKPKAAPMGRPAASAPEPPRKSASAPEGATLNEKFQSLFPDAVEEKG